MAQNKKFPWAFVVVGVGAACILGLCLILAGGAAYYYLNRDKGTASIPEAVSATLEAADILPEETPTAAVGIPEPIFTEAAPGEKATAVAPQSSAPTEAQVSSDSLLSDDFSSDALGWPVADDEMVLLEYADGAYRFKIKEQAYYDYAYFPSDFYPSEVTFDVQSPDGDQDGTFGVFCQLQDGANYYYVEITLVDGSYLIGQYLNDEDILLSEPGPDGGDWQMSEALNIQPGAVNHLAVSCSQTEISFYVNDQWVDTVNVEQPFTQAGDMAFFVYAFEDGVDGYEVSFDNVTAWEPVQ